MTKTEPKALERFDLTIIGAGPVGMYAAYYAGFRRLKTKLIDSLNELGGQVVALYPEKSIHDVAGFPDIRGKDLVRMLERQMSQFHTTIALGERAQSLTRESDGTLNIETDKSCHRSKAVLIAGGLGLFTPRKFDNPAVDQWEWRGLTHGVTDLHDFDLKRVVVVGGGDSAVDWALHLHRNAAHVTLVHRTDRFRAHEDSVAKVFDAVDVKTFHTVVAVHGEHEIQEVEIQSTKTGERSTIHADRVVACLGFLSNPGPIANWGLALENDGIQVSIRMESSVPGVYAAGDMAQYAGKPKLISVGFGEAAVAVNNAAVYIDPTKRVFPGHSSNKPAEK
ncbi:MAG: NAD(P)/FAD-dependent oxidoreductase [Deltaproteobacteria bacterium]|nr:NAD(P)/FAD-dependent oxidoreductase [Deltaproteobacteria bacterium]